MPPPGVMPPAIRTRPSCSATAGARLGWSHRPGARDDRVAGSKTSAVPSARIGTRPSSSLTAWSMNPRGVEVEGRAGPSSPSAGRTARR